MDTILNELGINDYNFGACSGKDGWSENENNKTLDSFNPSNGNRIASVYMADSNDYERILKDSTKSFNSFRKIPAPVRGDLVRQMGDALRAKKDVLGSLVSLEMGKIKQEGDGEVQEMIDIADFAVGQSNFQAHLFLLLKHLPFA
jgi:aldehyde dehydrogenase (NAD+)